MTSTPRIATPLLSFCVPTYNRVGSVVPLVSEVLSSPSDEIEIVISDNRSSDDTVARLAEIDDPRLVVIRSEVNRGALFNQVNVLLQGSGTYSALLLDKDSVNPQLIPSLLEFLRQASPVTGYCEYHQPLNTAARLFQQGADALLGMAYSCHHPTGYFFRKADLLTIDIVERFSEHANVGNFPFEFMQAELALRGSAAIFQVPVFVPESSAAAKAVKSFTINGAADDAFFSPNGRLKTAARFCAHILGLPLASHVKRKLIFDQFSRGLIQSTLDYRNAMANEDVCHHYHIQPRSVSVTEMLRTAWWFYRQFTVQVIADKSGSVPISKASLIADTLRRLREAIGRRLSRHFE